MNTAVWFLLALALVAANAPFLTGRLFFVRKLAQRKSIASHLLELLVFYLAVGAVGMGLEHQAGQIAPQRWEFYAITACVFLTFAFPGFVWRFLLKR